MKFRFKFKKEVKQLPNEPGVYCLKGKDILYVGKASNLRGRVKNHFQQPGYKDFLFLDKIRKIGYIQTNSEIEALILEANLIKKYQPKYNVLWRDDKNYFYVGITQEDFPRVFITHQTKKLSPKAYALNPKFIGPFVDGRALKKTLRTLRKIFSYYTSKKHPKGSCPWCHLNLCPGPNPLKKDYKKNIKNLISVLKGRKKSVLKNLKKEMEEAARLQDFEKAAKIRDQITNLEKVLENAKIFQLETFTDPSQLFSGKWKEIEKELERILKSRKKISRIEAYDVSNIQGQEATGSMVVFINGVPNKNFYRRFKIKISGKPNDTAMIKEILSRRLKHWEWPYPDLILIDGGKLQLNAACQCLTWNVKHIGMMALAKKKNELFVKGRKKSILLKTLPREIFNLILQLRDEAHRFAIVYHRKLRKKKLIIG